MPYEFGDVVLVRFPFTNQLAFKQRPAVVISNQAYNIARPDAVIMAITSQLNPPFGLGGVLIDQWQAANLLKPSAIKPVVATLEQSLLLRRLGSLQRQTRRRCGRQSPLSLVRQPSWPSSSPTNLSRGSSARPDTLIYVMLDLQNPVQTPIRQRVAAAERIVVKVGTNVIMRDDGAPAVGLVYGLVEAAVNVLRAGKQILLVSSGAIGLGAKCLKLERPPTELALKQACAAIGQSRLMSLYQDAFSHFDIATAQILLTEDDFLDPVRYSNLLATLATLLGLGVVPIINENDTVSTLELDRPGQEKSAHSGDRVPGERIFGDNDKLSALVMTNIYADLLILLSDVDGLYTRHPSESDSTFVREVEAITPALLAYARPGPGPSRGRGGMSTKIEAARLAVDAGRIAVIANGRVPGMVQRVCSGDDVGTVFYPSEGAPEGGRP